VWLRVLATGVLVQETQMRNGVLPNAACDGVVDGLLAQPRMGYFRTPARDGVDDGRKSPRHKINHDGIVNTLTQTTAVASPDLRAASHHPRRLRSAKRCAQRSRTPTLRTVARAAAAEPR